MRYRALGRTGLTVSAIGFGGWGIGGRTPGDTSYGARDDAESLAALDAALDHGITFYDTAAAYGEGHSETLIGRAFAGAKRERAVLATKAGMTTFGVEPDWRPCAIRASVEASLRRLATDRLDLLQLHDPSLALLRARPEIIAALDELRASGKIRAWGLSLKSPLDGIAAIQEFGAATLQVNLNLLDQRAVECGLLDVASTHGTGIIARTPLAFGYLTGELTTTSQFVPGDHRNRWSMAQRAAWLRGAALFAAETAAWEPGGIARAALRFAISQPAVATTAVGILTAGEAVTNAAAGALDGFDAAQRARLLALYRARNFFVG